MKSSPSCSCIARDSLVCTSSNLLDGQFLSLSCKTKRFFSTLLNMIFILCHDGVGTHWSKTNFLYRISLEFDAWKCEFCEKCDLENVNFVKNEILRMWILWKMRFWECEFCGKWVLKIVNFVKNEALKIVNFNKNKTLKIWILSRIESK